MKGGKAHAVRRASQYGHWVQVSAHHIPARNRVRGVHQTKVANVPLLADVHRPSARLSYSYLPIVVAAHQQELSAEVGPPCPHLLIHRRRDVSVHKVAEHDQPGGTGEANERDKSQKILLEGNYGDAHPRGLEAVLGAEMDVRHDHAPRVGQPERPRRQ